MNYKKIYRYFIICLLVFCACQQKDQSANGATDISLDTHLSYSLSATEAIAYKPGLDLWDDVIQIDFTFNVDRSDKQVAKRRWSWKPKID